MVKIIQPPKTIVRVAVLDSSLEEAVKKFDSKCFPLVVGLGNTNKYASYNPEGNYLLIVSKQIDGQLTPQGYNSILTVTSRVEETSRGVIKRFEEAAGISYTREAPQFLQDFGPIWDSALLIFEKHGDKAMDILRSMR